MKEGKRMKEMWEGREERERERDGRRREGDGRKGGPESQRVEANCPGGKALLNAA